jgi:fibronectin-binding autotransporter adhesin
MTTTTISSGVVSSSLSVNDGDLLTVLSGGQAVSPWVASGGLTIVSSGASVDGLGFALGGVVKGAGRVVANGAYGAGQISGLTIGQRSAFLGATSLDLQSGGLASGLTLEYGFMTVESGAVASATTLADQTGYAPLAAVGVYGSVVGGVINAGAVMTVYSSGLVSGVSVRSGGSLSVTGQAGGLMISSGGHLDYNVTVSSGLTLSAGTIGANTVIGGATLLSGAVLSVDGASVLNGGTLVLTSQSRADNLSVSAGGNLLGAGVLAGSSFTEVAGRISGIRVGDPFNDYANGQLIIRSGGVASNVMVGNAHLSIESGGISYGAALFTFGLGGVYNPSWATVDGVAVGTVIGAGSTEYAGSGGIVSGAVVSSAGTEYVFLGGVARGVTVLAGAS